VLDLCASPGSKASQIIEMMHWDVGSDIPKGAVVANDIDAKRADTLKHTLNRLGSPTTIVTQVDARFFPNLVTRGGQSLLFDRILADVPCSGDGTLRKHPALWDKWKPKDALDLHHRQYTILCRGLDLLRPGGRLVYSTCSFNPVEDEAVVAAALMRYGAGFRLCPPPLLQGLKGQPGLKTWFVPHPNDGTMCWAKLEDVPTELRSHLQPSLFAPAPGSDFAHIWDDSSKHCRRFLPHTCRSGGFFATIFEKIPQKQCSLDTASACTPTTKVEEMQNKIFIQEDVATCQETFSSTRADDGQGKPAQDGTAMNAEALRVARRERRSAKKPLQSVSDIQPLDPNDPGWLKASAFFGLDCELALRLRRRGAERKIFCVSEQVIEFLESRSPFKMRVISAGVRVLEQMGPVRKDGVVPPWRLAHEGLPVLLQHGLRRSVALCRGLFTQLLCKHKLDISEILTAVQSNDAKSHAELCASGVAATVTEHGDAGIIPGSIAVTMLPEAGECYAPQFAVAALLSAKGLELFVPRSEAIALLESMGLEARTTSIFTGSTSAKRETASAKCEVPPVLLEGAALACAA